MSACVVHTTSLHVIMFGVMWVALLVVGVGAAGPSGLGPGAGMWEMEDPAAVGLSTAALSRAAEEVARVAPMRYVAHTRCQNLHVSERCRLQTSWHVHAHRGANCIRARSV